MFISVCVSVRLFVLGEADGWFAASTLPYRLQHVESLSCFCLFIKLVFFKDAHDEINTWAAPKIAAEKTRGCFLS